LNKLFSGTCEFFEVIQTKKEGVKGVKRRMEKLLVFGGKLSINCKG